MAKALPPVTEKYKPVNTKAKTKAKTRRTRLNFSRILLSLESFCIAFDFMWMSILDDRANNDELRFHCVRTRPLKRYLGNHDTHHSSTSWRSATTRNIANRLD